MDTQWTVAPGTTHYQCPTTGEWFPAPDAYQITEDGFVVWIWCPFCDTQGRTHTEEGFAPDEPQPHAYTIKREMIV